MGREPKDFDVVPTPIRNKCTLLFRNCRLIGRRFRLAHIQFGREIIEVATFRAHHDDDQDPTESHRHLDNQGRIISDNLYGSIEEDAWRRDFTINALYYDINDFSVLDYAGGLSDLQQGIVRLIGEPEQRYREDPVRMLRAVRFAARLGFRLHPATEAPLRKLSHLLKDIPPARLFDEVLKLLLSGYAVQTFELMRHYHLFGYLFPATERCLSRQQQHFPKTLLIHALTNTDTRIAEDKPVTPAFLFAALLWEPLQDEVRYLQEQGMQEGEALQEAAEQVVNAQLKHTALPRRFSLPMREIWFLQPRFTMRSGSRPGRFLLHPRFRAAYDFLLLRAACDEALAELANWWTDFIALDEPDRKAAVRTLGKPTTRTRSRRRRVARRKTSLSQTD
ncbi:MAG: polynucleotide adenylyltransferase PcnB [Candidatus Competibacteraceae bacterium]